jgi:hypothetical protein
MLLWLLNVCAHCLRYSHDVIVASSMTSQLGVR